jgi:hypothetical protein
MGLFSAIREGAFAAKVLKSLASRLGIPVSAIPQHLRDGMLRSCAMYKQMGYSVDDAVEVLLTSTGEILAREIRRGDA